MMWQIDHLKRRYVNSNYVLREIVMTMFNCYWFHIQNMVQWPLQSEAEVNRMRYFYWNYYKPIEDKIEPDVFKQLYIQSADGRNIEQRGVVPKLTIHEFLDELASAPYEERPDDDVDGSEPIHLMYEDTPEDTPYEVHDYTNGICKFFNSNNNNTNLARMDGMYESIKKERVPFAELRTVKSDPRYDENGKRILRDYNIIAFDTNQNSSKIQPTISSNLIATDQHVPVYQNIKPNTFKQADSIKEAVTNTYTIDNSGSKED